MSKPVAALCALFVGLFLAASAAANEASDAITGPGPGSLTGRVSTGEAPLGDVAVYAYQLADLSLDRSSTDRDGKFSFSALPAGLYKIIAYKQGFVPAVVLLTRATASTYQFLDFELSEERLAKESDGSDFWSVRGRIPRDVLREMRLAEWQEPEQEMLADGFSAEMQALAGVGENAQLGSGQLTDAKVGVEGRLGDLELGVRGRLRELQPNALSAQTLDGEARSQAISLSLRSENQARFDFVSEQSTLTGVKAPMDLRHYGVSWSQPLGAAGRSRFAASYTDENNFYRDGSLDPLDLPAASRTFHVEGSYEATVSEHSFRTGVRYRQRLLAVPEMSTFGDSGLPYERIDLFGLDGWSVLPTVIVEYGLFSTLADGSLSLTPHGGLVIDLSKNWSAAGVVRQRLSQEEPDERMRDFVPMSYAQSADCGTTEEHCYRLELSRKLGSDEERFSVGALHREFADTLRLYFNQDFFNQLESLFLVRGDQVPELKLSVSQRLSRNVFAELQSSIGSGGGGVFQAADSRSYQNHVRYLATSLNTEFENTSTGLLLAFHRIEQELSPMSASGDPTTPMAMDRLQILLTQDLDAILHMATDLALLLDMQLSRGSTLYDDLPSDELRHQVVGGIAVKF